MTRGTSISCALVLALLATASANPDPAKRKATPDKFAKAAGDAFREAVAADQKGELSAALGLYQKAYAISPHPSSIYNIADVQRRLGLLVHAIKSYETYLALAPAATDRADVEAVIEKLARTPGSLLIVTTPASDPNALDFTSGYVIIDGEIKRKPGTVAKPTEGTGTTPAIVIEVPPGDHVVDVITPISYGSRSCGVRPGERARCSITAPPRTDGAAVVSASERRLQVKTDRRGRTLVNTRFELTPGRHELMLRDRSFECPALDLDVATGGDVTFAYISTHEYDGLERCRTLDTKQYKLHFEP
jgi:tetratricopeptide (TPR) repeat protein